MSEMSPPSGVTGSPPELDRAPLESQKLMWVIVSVSLLLVLVLAGGLYWLRPADGSLAATGLGSGDLEAPGARAPTFDSFEFVRDQLDAPGMDPPAVSDQPAQQIVGDAQPGALDSPRGQRQPGTGADALDALDAPLPTGTAAGVTASGQPSRITGKTGEPLIEVMPPARSAPRPQVSVQPGRRPATPATAAPPTASSGRAAASPAPATATTAAAAAAGAAPAGPHYWIQVASFSSRGRADALAREMERQGLESRITTRAAGDAVYYRVRVGPYASKQEAAKFLTWLQHAAGLGSSYISVVY